MRVWAPYAEKVSAEHVYIYILYENDENSVLKPPAVNTISAAYYIHILDLRIFSVRVRNSIPLMCIIYTCKSSGCPNTTTLQLCSRSLF